MRKFRKLSDMSGRVAAITGGAGCTGRVIAETLLELGATVVLIDCDEDKLVKASAHLRQIGFQSVDEICADLEVEDRVRALSEEISVRHGRLDVLVNNAAYVGTSNLSGWVVPFEDQSANVWRRALEVNLTSAFILSQSCAPMLRKTGNGVILNIASIYGIFAPDMRLYEGTDMGNPAAYAASKGGVIQLTRWLASVMAPAVRVNAISPGGIERDQPMVFRKRYAERTPLKRMGKEEDLVGAVAFLTSDLSRYVTGQNILVDGGWSIW